MKNLKRNGIIVILLLVLSFFGLSSCSDDDSAATGTQPPVITSVNATLVDGVASDLSPVTQGYANNMYIIRGTGLSTVQKIFFNDFESYFNPALVTDTAIFVTIDSDTPYFDAIDELRVETLYGTAVFTFVTLPAPPIIESYNPINAQTGDVVTIYGQYFLDPVVTVGDTQATVISSTVSEITFTMPANSQNKYITVQTLSGSATSTQAVGSAFYDDVIYSLNTGSSGLWSGNDEWDTNYTDDATQGLKSMKCVFGGWNGLDMRRSSAVDLTPYGSLRIAVKGAEDGSLKCLLNDNWGATVELPITTEWVTLEIPFSSFGSPATFTGITFQESGGNGGNTILIDDIGFVLN